MYGTEVAIAQRCAIEGGVEALAAPPKLWPPTHPVPVPGGRANGPFTLGRGVGAAEPTREQGARGREAMERFVRPSTASNASSSSTRGATADGASADQPLQPAVRSYVTYDGYCSRQNAALARVRAASTVPIEAPMGAPTLAEGAASGRARPEPQPYPHHTPSVRPSLCEDSAAVASTDETRAPYTEVAHEVAHEVPTTAEPPLALTADALETAEPPGGVPTHEGHPEPSQQTEPSQQRDQHEHCTREEGLRVRRGTAAGGTVTGRVLSAPNTRPTRHTHRSHQQSLQASAVPLSGSGPAWQLAPRAIEPELSAVESCGPWRSDVETTSGLWPASPLLGASKVGIAAETAADVMYGALRAKAARLSRREVRGRPPQCVTPGALAPDLHPDDLQPGAPATTPTTSLLMNGSLSASGNGSPLAGGGMMERPGRRAKLFQPAAHELAVDAWWLWMGQPDWASAAAATPKGAGGVRAHG